MSEKNGTMIKREQKKWDSLKYLLKTVDVGGDRAELPEKTRKRQDRNYKGPNIFLVTPHVNNGPGMTAEQTAEAER